MGRVIESLLTNLYQETGMFVSVLAVGNLNSRLRSKIEFKRLVPRLYLSILLKSKCYSYHVGKNKFGADFQDWHPNWEDAIKEKFISFYEEAAGQSDSESSVVAYEHNSKESSRR